MTLTVSADLVTLRESARMLVTAELQQYWLPRGARLERAAAAFGIEHERDRR